MKAFIATQLLAMLAAATAADSVRGARELAAEKAVAATAITTFSKIKLAGSNAIAPFEGVESATGTADVKLDYNSLRTSGKWIVCINTTINGFTPGLLQIRKAKINANGNVKVDFSKQPIDEDPTFSGCVNTTELVYNDMRDNPVRQIRAAS